MGSTPIWPLTGRRSATDSASRCSRASATSWSLAGFGMIRHACSCSHKPTAQRRRAWRPVAPRSTSVRGLTSVLTCGPRQTAAEGVRNLAAQEGVTHSCDGVRLQSADPQHSRDASYGPELHTSSRGGHLPRRPDSVDHHYLLARCPRGAATSTRFRPACARCVASSIWRVSSRPCRAGGQTRVPKFNRCMQSVWGLDKGRRGWRAALITRDRRTTSARMGSRYPARCSGRCRKVVSRAPVERLRLPGTWTTVVATSEFSADDPIARVRPSS